MAGGGAGFFAAGTGVAAFAFSGFGGSGLPFAGGGTFPAGAGFDDASDFRAEAFAACASAFAAAAFDGLWCGRLLAASFAHRLFIFVFIG